MSDIFTKAKRSFVMSRIRSRGNKDTEVALAKLLRRHKITGWRRQVELRITNRELRTGKMGNGNGRITNGELRTGGQKIRSSKFEVRNFKVRPDFVFRQVRLAVFVDGCFWHGCPRHGTQPKGNRAFWKKKFARNLARDRRVNRALRSANWRVLRIWEHELAKIKTTATPHSGPLPVRGGEGAEARLLNRLHRALG